MSFTIRSRTKLWIGLGGASLCLVLCWQAFAPKQKATLSLPPAFAVYEEYADGTLLLSKKKYREALENALQLKVKLEDKSQNLSDFSYLYATNLFRIGLLYKELGQAKEEKALWSQFTEILQNPANPLQMACHKFLQGLSVEDLKGKDFIEHRQKELSTQVKPL